jgi:hypothetical protein
LETTVTVYQGTKTTVEIDRKRGRLRVYCAKTGRLMYELTINIPEPKCAS